MPCNDTDRLARLHQGVHVLQVAYVSEFGLLCLGNVNFVFDVLVQPFLKFSRGNSWVLVRRNEDRNGIFALALQLLNKLEQSAITRQLFNVHVLVRSSIVVFNYLSGYFLIFWSEKPVLFCADFVQINLLDVLKHLGQGFADVLALVFIGVARLIDVHVVEDEVEVVQHGLLSLVNTIATVA